MWQVIPQHASCADSSVWVRGRRLTQIRLGAAHSENESGTMDSQGGSKQQRRGRKVGGGQDGRELAALNLLCGLFRCLTDPKTVRELWSHAVVVIQQPSCDPNICVVRVRRPLGNERSRGGRVSKTITTYWFLLYVLHYSCTAKRGEEKEPRRRRSKPKRRLRKKPKQKQHIKIKKQRGPSGIFPMF